MTTRITHPITYRSLPITAFITVRICNHIVGSYLALGHMKEGDIWRVDIPSDLAYGSSGYSYEYSGFGGQNALGANIPVVMDLELVRVVKDPGEYEASLVQNYAVGQLRIEPVPTPCVRTFTL